MADTGSMVPSRIQSGFSLPELLLSLLIIANIAVFAIPKVLNSQADAQRKAVFRETIALLSEATYLGVLQGELTGNTLEVYYSTHLNYVRFCDSASSTQNCWAHTAAVSSNNLSEPGFILHNGATLAGFNNQADDHEHIIMDWNGPDDPNLEGEDQIALRLAFETSGSQRAGTVTPRPSFPVSEAAFQEIFK